VRRAERLGLLHLPAEVAERLHGLLHPGHHPARREGPRGRGRFGRRLEPGGGGVGVGPLAVRDGGDGPAHILAGPAMVGGGLGDQAALGWVVEAVELLDLGHGQLGEQACGQVVGDDVGGDASAEQALAEAVLLELVAVGVDEGAEADSLGGVAAGVGGGVAGEQIVEDGLADGDAEREQMLAGRALDLGQDGRKIAGGERYLGHAGSVLFERAYSMPIAAGRVVRAKLAGQPTDIAESSARGHAPEMETNRRSPGTGRGGPARRKGRSHRECRRAQNLSDSTSIDRRKRAAAGQPRPSTVQASCEAGAHHPWHRKCHSCRLKLRRIRPTRPPKTQGTKQHPAEYPDAQ
jgi:hypothetical protein